MVNSPICTHSVLAQILQSQLTEGRISLRYGNRSSVGTRQRHTIAKCWGGIHLILHKSTFLLEE